MKTTIDIIESVKDGERPDYDELRYALLVMDYLEGDMYHDVLLNLFGKDKLQGLDKLRFKMHSESRQKILNNDAKKAIGSFDPDLPGRQEERALHKKIGEKFMTAQAGEGADNE
jgi:hypothetical protein